MSCVDPQAVPPPISVTRGESATLQLTVRNAAKQPVALTGAKVWFTVKNRIEDVAAVIAKKNLAGGGADEQILITLPQTLAAIGQVKIFLAPPDTAGLDPQASYWCDAWVELTSGQRYQVLSNRPFKIDPAVTTVFT